MEEDEFETSSGSNLIPVALAILAIVLGAAGLYFGMTANQRISPITETIEAGSSSTARLEKDLAALETQLTELSVQNAELKKTVDRMRIYSSQAEQAVKKLDGGVKANRGEIIKMAERLNEMTVAPVVRAPAPASTTETTAGGGASPTASAGPGGTYTIESGDYFAKIAEKLGVDLQALLDANPDADPRRLRIGQVINVPGN